MLSETEESPYKVSGKIDGNCGAEVIAAAKELNVSILDVCIAFEIAGDSKEAIMEYLKKRK